MELDKTGFKGHKKTTNKKHLIFVKQFTYKIGMQYDVSDINYEQGINQCLKT